MKSKVSVFFRFEILITICILISYSLIWISWNKVNLTGWNLPILYKKITTISNTVIFFLKKDSPHTAYVLYIIPALSIIATCFTLLTKYKTANCFLFLSTLFGLTLSIYMYSYLLNSKMMKLYHSEVGLHILAITCFSGLIYSFIHLCRKKQRNNDKEVILNEE